MQFLDEADFLADNVAILAAPGLLVAEGSPVALKSSLGEGYTVQVSFTSSESSEKLESGMQTEVLRRIRSLAPSAYMTSIFPLSTSYHLCIKDTFAVGQILALFEQDKESLGIVSYEVRGTSLEDIFLSLMKEHGQGLPEQGLMNGVNKNSLEGMDIPIPELGTPKILGLTNGRRRSPFSQAFTIFYKRCLVARRSWLTPVLSLVIAVAGSCIPLFFLSGRAETCVKAFDPSPVNSLYFPLSFLQVPLVISQHDDQILTSPPGIATTLGPTESTLLTEDIQNNASFVTDIKQNFRNLSLGGISIDTGSGNSLFAWEATSPGLTGPTMLNLASNVLYNNALNSSGRSGGSPSIIMANLQDFPSIDGGTLFALKWTAFFGAAMVCSS